MCLPATSGGSRSYGNEDINFYTNSYMNTSEKVELTASICHIDNQEYRFTNPKCRTRLVEKRKTEDKGEEDHRQLQSVMCFMQTHLENINKQKKLAYYVMVL